MPTTLESMIEFLRSPDAYPHRPAEVTVIQTHISWVFLAGDHVYKIKKPVSLGFLDFSTIEKRRHYCEEEVRLNRRMCGDIYEGVVPISQRGGRYTVDDSIRIVEYAVKMKRLEGGEFGHALLENGAFGRSEIDRVVGKLASFYMNISSTPETAAWGRIEKLRISTDENFEQIEPFQGALLLKPAFDAIRYYTNRFYDVHARLLNKRRAGGHVIDAHGDLHLEHVYLKPDEVCIYDCIEFNDRFRWIDIASDVAFLAMDLDFHGHPNLARYFGSKMSQRLNDPGLLKLLDFYKCYRAVVRGKVEGIRSSEDEVPEDERLKSISTARRYFSLALRYAVAGSSPLALIVMGRVGTGKSTMASQFADAFSWKAVSSDLVRKELAGVEPFERGDASLYTSQRTRETYAALTERALEELEAGHGVVVDATYSSREDREALRTTLADAGYTSAFVELTAGDDTLRERLRQRKRNVSDARVEDFDMLNRRYEAPDDLEDALHIRVSTEKEEAAAIKEALECLIRLDLGR